MSPTVIPDAPAAVKPFGRWARSGTHSEICQMLK